MSGAQISSPSAMNLTSSMRNKALFLIFSRIIVSYFDEHQPVCLPLITLKTCSVNIQEWCHRNTNNCLSSCVHFIYNWMSSMIVPVHINWELVLVLGSKVVDLSDLSSLEECCFVQRLWHLQMESHSRLGILSCPKPTSKEILQPSPTKSNKHLFDGVSHKIPTFLAPF